jgi:Transglycosylase SLT domain
MTLKTGLFAAAAAAALLAGCADSELKFDTLFSTKNAQATDQSMRWDFHPEAEAWTARTVAAIDNHGANLVNTMPADIDTWCPAYKKAGEEGRKAFWTGLLSTLAKHESTWNPSAVGGGGLWYGLVQIAPATARHYGCEARSGEALKDGELNLSCAVRIMDVTVPRDGVVSQNMRGVAADWGPFHNAAKREDMITWMRAQPYCAS